MLTCYDFTTARLMQEAGVPMLLVGDSAAKVVLGHDTTLPVSLGFMIEITAAVRRGRRCASSSPTCLLDRIRPQPRRGYGTSCRMIKRTGCDCVKLEVGPTTASVVSATDRCRRRRRRAPRPQTAVGRSNRGLSFPGSNSRRGRRDSGIRLANGGCRRGRDTARSRASRGCQSGC